MKNLKLTTTFLAIVVLIMAGTLNSRANDIMHEEEIIKPLYSDLHFEILDIVNEYEVNKENSIVAIYDHNGKIVAFGVDNDRNLKTIINNSDFLTEINGKKYFRLSSE